MLLKHRKSCDIYQYKANPADFAGPIYCGAKNIKNVKHTISILNSFGSFRI